MTQFGFALASIPVLLTPVATWAQALRPLGTFPICEPSAALFWSCPESNEGCLLVADNEMRDQLFSLDLARLDSRGYQSVYTKMEISDIEALTRLKDAEYLLMGSHGRSRECRPRGNRRRLATGQIVDGALQSAGPVETEKIRCRLLFSKEDLEKQAELKPVCAQVDLVEDRADAIWTDTEQTKEKLQNEEDPHQREILQSKLLELERACNTSGAFNVEGVAAVIASDEEDVWVGLRAPLLPKDPNGSASENLAILLRMTSPSRFKFDRASFLDLGGRGVRELAVHGEWLYLIAGPAHDQAGKFQLLRVGVADLEPGRTITPSVVAAEVDASAEGLALVGTSAYLIFDGDTGDEGWKCDVSGKYSKFKLPND